MAASEALHPDQFPTLYHGTHREEGVEAIRQTGLRQVAGHILSPARWPTLTTSRAQAERYGPHVVEVHLSPEAALEHLHPEQEHTAYGFDAKAYSVKKHIPPEHVR